MDNDKNPVQSAGKIFQLMETLAEQGPCGLIELSQLLGINKSTVHRLLNSLIYMGYVSQEPETLKYYMTLKIVNVSAKVLKHMDILMISEPYLQDLMEKTYETVHLVKRTGNDLCYIHKLEPSNTGRSIQMASFVGMVSPLYCTAVGKAIMAHLPEAEVRHIWNSSVIAPKTEYTLRSIEQLLDELKEVRERGYALDNEENELGVRCIAASIKNFAGVCDYAISISAPTSRMSDSRLQELSHLIKNAAAKLSAEMGYIK